MAVVATLSKGYDLDYMWRQAGPGSQKEGAGYYLQASEDGGEPPGRWWGPAAEALGFQQGQLVEREPYDLLFGERKAPDGTPLGRPPGGGRKAADIYAQLLAAEPHATAERKHELRIEAAQQARQSPLYFDLTVSLSKSISIFHASLGENARQARQAGDQQAEQHWAGLMTEVDQMIYQAVWAGLSTSSARPGTPAPARTPPGWTGGKPGNGTRPAWRWRTGCSTPPATATCSCTSTPRSPTPPRRSWTASGGRRTPTATTSTSARSPRLVSQHLEEALTRRFGVEWVARDDGHGFEIKGISGEMMRLFSSRRESITADLRARATQFEAAVRARAVASVSSRSSRRRRTSAPARPRTARWTSRSCTRGGRTSSRAASACRWRRSRRRCGEKAAVAHTRTRAGQSRPA